MGDGTHYLNISHELQAGAGVESGDLVTMIIARDIRKEMAVDEVWPGLKFMIRRTER